MGGTKSGPEPSNYLNIYQPSPEHWIALCPNGQNVAFVLKDPNENVVPVYPTFTPPHLGGFRLRIVSLGSEECYAPLDDSGRSFAPVWSPDGTKLAFYADHDGRVQLYIWRVDLKQAQIVCEDPVRCFPWVERLHWLDNERVCLSLLPEKNGFEGYLYSSSGAAARVSQRPLRSQPGREPTAQEVYWEGARHPLQSPRPDPDEQWYRTRAEIAVVDVNSGRVSRIVTDIGARMAFPSPDGKMIAFDTVPTAKSDMRSMKPDPSVKIYLVDAYGDGEPVLVTTGLSFDPWSRVMWSPNSDEFAFVQNGKLNAWSVGEGALYTFRDNEGRDLNVTSVLWGPNGDGWLVQHGRALSWLSKDGTRRALRLPDDKMALGVLRPLNTGWFWNPDGNSFVLLTRDRHTNDNGFYRIALNGGDPESLSEEAGAFRAATFSGDHHMADVCEGSGCVAYWKEDYDRPPELFVTEDLFRSSRRVTRLNPALGRVDLGLRQLITWTGRDGRPRKGALFTPRNASDRRYPVVAVVYPNYAASEYSNSWSLNDASAILPPQLLIENGMAVFLPDLYTSEDDLVTAYAGEFTLAINAAIESGRVDEVRVGAMGHSFGGYLVNCLITQISTLKAAVSSGSWGNLSTLWGTSYSRAGGALDAYGVQLVETNPSGPKLESAPWECPDAYIRNSPVFRLDRIHAALLLVGGADDPLYQPEEMVLGLQRLGKEVHCVRYLGEGHTPREWAIPNREDLSRRVITWFKEHLGVEHSDV